MQEWNKIFGKKGKVFTKPQEDLSRIAKLFKKHNAKRILEKRCQEPFYLKSRILRQTQGKELIKKPR